MPEIRTLMRYAAANPDTDRGLMEVCMEAAMQWLENAGVTRREDNALYDMGVYMLATHYFDNRGVVSENSNQQIPLGVFSIMHQLRNEPSGGVAH